MFEWEIRETGLIVIRSRHGDLNKGIGGHKRARKKSSCIDDEEAFNDLVFLVDNQATSASSILYL